jgi:hypothetical protein
MASHASLTPGRWATFSLGRQARMIVSEMPRTGPLTSPAHRARLRNGDERILALAGQAHRPSRRSPVHSRPFLMPIFNSQPQTTRHGV